MNDKDFLKGMIAYKIIMDNKNSSGSGGGGGCGTVIFIVVMVLIVAALFGSCGNSKKRSTP